MNNTIFPPRWQSTHPRESSLFLTITAPYLHNIRVQGTLNVLFVHGKGMVLYEILCRALIVSMVLPAPLNLVKPSTAVFTDSGMMVSD